MEDQHGLKIKVTLTRWHLNENLVWAKWGIFMSEGEDWEVFGKLRNMGRIRSETFHICRPAKVCKKTFSTMQKLFDQLENLYLRKLSILFASAYYISVLSLTGIWKTIVATISTNTNDKHIQISFPRKKGK